MHRVISRALILAPLLLLSARALAGILVEDVGSEPTAPGFGPSADPPGEPGPGTLVPGGDHAGA